MPPTVADVIARLDESIGFAKAADWDPVGLQFGDPSAAAGRVAVCHEVTTSVVEAVEADPVDLLVAYHPLLFRPTRRLIAGPSAEGRAFRLMRSGVSLAVVHTAYDVAPGGTADALADALGVHDRRGTGPVWGAAAVKIVTFAPHDAIDAIAAAMSGAGAGHIGAYSACSFRVPGTGTFLAPVHADPATGRAGAMNVEPETRLEMIAPVGARDAVVGALVAAHPYEEPAYDIYEVSANAGFVGRVGVIDPVPLDVFVGRVEETLDTACRVAAAGDTSVGRVAVVPGSGSDLIGRVAGDADVLVTSDVSHHRAQEALSRGLAVVDAGHVATERPGLARLYASVAEEVDAVSLLHLDPSPWRRR